MNILRFITAGSVDDGKSTLIGRLLFDSKSIMTDQLEALEQQTKNKQAGNIDLALLTDGLRAEREQGITIDVAYKYFSTPKRKFIIADAPGHIQYTRNMVTGASNADLIILLVDARNGISEQTKRHALIASLLKIKHVIVAVNKMDLIENPLEVYNNIVSSFSPIAESLELDNISYIPISALNGDNIVTKSNSFPWYDGESLLSILEQTEVSKDINLTNGRFCVQYVIRPQTKALHDYRGYAGKIISGIYKVGDKIKILPTGITTSIKAIEVSGKPVNQAFAPQSAIIHTSEDIDISRGDLIVQQSDLEIQLSNEIQADLCWMGQTPISTGSRLLLQINSTLVKVIIKSIHYKLNVNTLQKEEFPEKLVLNDVAHIELKLSSAIPFDSYKNLKSNGAAILVDETSNVTVGACMFT
jgi:sulfate adenylyltransferase subunit 1